MNNLDIFQDMGHVESVCGMKASGESAICWFDAFHYSILSKSDLGKVYYELGSTYGDLVGYSIWAEFVKFKLTPDKAAKFLQDYPVPFSELVQKFF